MRIQIHWTEIKWVRRNNDKKYSSSTSGEQKPVFSPLSYSQSRNFVAQVRPKSSPIHNDYCSIFIFRPLRLLARNNYLVKYILGLLSYSQLNKVCLNKVIEKKTSHVSIW